MAEYSHKWLKGLLWFVAMYHIALGLLGIFFKESAVFVAKSFFNFNLTLTPEIYWTLNPFAAYLLIFGVFMALAATDPVKYKNIIFIGVALFAVRVVQRVVFFFAAPEGLISNMDPVRNILVLVVVSAIGLSMYLLAKRVK